MTQTEDKLQEVRRMLSAGRELSDEQRLALLRLHARFDQLWQQRESAQGTARQPTRPADQGARR